MKSIYCVLFLFLFISTQLLAQVVFDSVFTGCGADLLIKNNPKLLSSQEELDNAIYKYLTYHSARSLMSFQTYTIPVVVHIIHNGGPEDISDAQVQTAIADINAKYAQNNADQIQFCLAQRDPYGNATTGITRNISAFTTDTMELNDTTLKNTNRWDPTCYLNIWVIKQIISLSMGNGVLGYAYFPSAYGTNMDGVVIVAGYFGSSFANDAVGAHEIGHYFGLYHTFQNGCPNNDCLLDGDHVCDTPPDQTTFAACVPPTNSCSTDADDTTANNPFKTDVDDNSDDYMDYSAFSCYNNFTPGQYTRMLYFLSNVRYSMLNCKSCMSPCPAPLTATITTPVSSMNIMTGTNVNFAGAATNAGSYQWFLISGSILNTTLSFGYTFNTMGNYWMKFKAKSNDTLLCIDAVDSLLITVTEPVLTSCSGSLNLDTVNSALRLPYTNQNYSSNGFTWECWFKLNIPLFTNSNYIHTLTNETDNVQCEDIALSFGWPGTANGDHLIFRADGPGGCAGRSPVENDYKPVGGFILGTWYHCAAVMNYATHISKLYVNGQLVSTVTCNSTPITRTAVTEVGWDEIDTKPGYPEPPLGANVDEIRVWNTARSDSEILANYNKCLMGNEPYLISYYRCNQTAGSQAVNTCINDSNATLYQGASWSTDQPVLAVNDCPSTNVTISNASVTICPGSSATLTVSGAANYRWSPATGLNKTIGDTIIASPSVSTSYTVTGTNGCDSTTAIANIIVNTVGTKILDLGSDISLCYSGTHTFNAGAGFESYLWQNASTDSTFTAYGPGKYWVTVKNFCSPILLSDTALVNLAATPSLDIGHDTTICITASIPLGYTSNGIFSTFQWYPDPDSALSCTTCPNPVITPSVSSRYYLSATTQDGCTNVDSILINVDPFCLPTPVSSFLASDSAICASDCINFVNSSINSTSWLWAFPGAAPSTSTDQNPQNVCYQTSGSYNVTLIANNGAESDTLTLSNCVIVKISPPPPLITYNNDTLLCSFDSSYASYQWYLDTTAIIGATDSFFVITQGGNYNIKVTANNGCFIGTGINITGIKEFSDIANISFNSVNHELYIYAKWKLGNGVLSIYNVLGKKVVQQQLKAYQQNIVNVFELAAGIYFLQVEGNETRYIKKIVIQ